MIYMQDNGGAEFGHNYITELSVCPLFYLTVACVATAFVILY